MWLNPDVYETNVRQGIHDDYLPAYVSEFAIAEKLRIAVVDLPDQPIGLVKAASVLLEAESLANRKQRQGSK